MCKGPLLAAVAAGLWANLLVPLLTPRPSEAQAPARTKWEYKTATDSRDELNRLGALGWEAFHVTDMHGAYLKRRK